MPMIARCRLICRWRDGWSEKHQIIRAQELRETYQGFLDAKADVNFRLPQEQKRVRILRALSWLDASEDVTENIENGGDPEKAELDRSFIFLWIAFNAAYGYDPNVFEPGETWQERKAKREAEENKEEKIIKRFIKQIKRIDDNADKALTAPVKSHGATFGGLIRNPFVYGKFWHWARNPRRKAKDFSPSKWKSSDAGVDFVKQNSPLTG